MLAIDDNASIFCARVMRGIWSIASALTWRAAIRAMRSWFLAGQRKLMSVAPDVSWSASVALGGCTFNSTSAAAHRAALSPTIVAPAFT